MKKQRKKRKDRTRKIYVLIAATVIVLLGFSAGWFLLAKEKPTQDIWNPKEPKKEQLVLLEKVYDEFRSFQYISDNFPFEWEGPYREKFEQLCGRKLDLNINVETNYFQTPSETLKRKGGDCEDFAILFVSAAKSLGISARVVMGSVQGPADPEPKDHTWCEIYYKGKWRIVDPDLVVEKRGVPFRKFIDQPEEFPMVKIDCKFDDKISEGFSPIEQLEAEKERCKKEVFDFLIYVFRNEKGREPSEKEINEIREAAKDLHNQQWAVALTGLPKDPRILIQPENPNLAEWIEKIKSMNKG